MGSEKSASKRSSKGAFRIFLGQARINLGRDQFLAPLPGRGVAISTGLCGEQFVGSFCPRCNPDSFDNSQYFSDHPPQLQFETYLCELCGNNAHYGYDCPPQFPFIFVEYNSCYDPYQPSQFPVNYPPQETSREILQAQEDLMEAIQAFLKEYDHIPPNEKCMALLLAEERFLKIKQAMEEEA
ncbi:hypothetical protein Tco_0045541 [Tanacetum coccineum]